MLGTRNGREIGSVPRSIPLKSYHVALLSHREIAQRLGVTENYSRQLLHRAIVQLSKQGLR